MVNKQICIAIIEDNQDLREELLFFLRTQGHSVWGVNSAEGFWKELHRTSTDIVLVDIGLPGEDGFSVVEFLYQIRRYGIIVLSAKGGQQDYMRGLNLGADHYLVKPVNFADLNDRVTSLWQRLQIQLHTITSSVKPSPQWMLQERTLISPEGKELLLSPQETVFMSFLLRNINSVCSKERLHDELFGYQSEPEVHRVDVIVSRLRIKARQNLFYLPIRVLFGKGLIFLNKSSEI